MARRDDAENEAFEAALVAGDREAVATRLLKFAEKVVQSKLYQFPPGLEAEDVISEAAFDALQRLAGWEKAKGRGMTYAYGAIQFVILDRMRKRRRYERRFVQLLKEDRRVA